MEVQSVEQVVESTMARDANDVVWTKISDYSSERFAPGAVVVKAKRGTAARYDFRGPVRLHSTASWGLTKDPYWIDVDPNFDSLITGENPVVGHVAPGEKVTVVSIWKASTVNHNAVPYGALKIVELRKADGTVGFAPAHFFDLA